MSEIKLEELSLQELKALAFDELMAFRRIEHNLNLLNQEITKRQQEGEVPPEAKT